MRLAGTTVLPYSAIFFLSWAKTLDLFLDKYQQLEQSDIACKALSSDLDDHDADNALISHIDHTTDLQYLQ